MFQRIAMPFIVAIVERFEPLLLPCFVLGRIILWRFPLLTCTGHDRKALWQQ